MKKLLEKAQVTLPIFREKYKNELNNTSISDRYRKFLSTELALNEKRLSRINEILKEDISSPRVTKIGDGFEVFLTSCFYTKWEKFFLTRNISLDLMEKLRENKGDAQRRYLHSVIRKN